MRKIVKNTVILLLVFLVGISFFACNDGGEETTPCTHIDKNDDNSCDICSEAYTDGCDNHADANDDGICDKTNCGVSFTDGCDVHRDENDDGYCDKAGCGASYTDACDVHRDANDDGYCDKTGCGVSFTDGCDVHRDANDDGYCDKAGCGVSFTDGCDVHRDANDDGYCDKTNCGISFTDGCDVHRDANDDGYCDKAGCGVSFTDGCDVHRDANDDGYCDKTGCGASFTDGCDVHRDANDDGYCDKTGCGASFTDGCDVHRDANDDGYCDKTGCGVSFTDACDVHRDANDDGYCDKTNCGISFTDGCDNPHYDNNNDGKCDFCKEEYTKKIIFIGNSHTYYGQTVLETAQTVYTQEERTGDNGYFYQLCKDNGMDVEITNWTFGGHGLYDLFDGSCAAGRGHDGRNHLADLQDRAFDYVVIQPGSGETSSKSFISDVEGIMELFRAENPNVKFVILVPYTAYGTIGSSLYLAKEFLNGLKTVSEQGAIIVDWGRLIIDILAGTVSVPNATQEYVKNTFVIAKSATDGYHPNQLSGYITTLMTYCAITGESAVGKSYGFCNDSSLREEGASAKFFDFATFISWMYKDGATTNYDDVFASSADMAGIQALIDAHLAAKGYLSYNLTGDEDFSGGGDSGGGEMTEQEAVAAGYVALLDNGGTKTYLTKADLEAKIKAFADGDVITLLTDVSCKGIASGSNTAGSSGTVAMTVVFDLNGKTLTLTEGGLLRARNNDTQLEFTLYSANGKGTLMLQADDCPAIVAYRSRKTIIIGSENGYADGDVVEIYAASLLYFAANMNDGGAGSTVTFWGGVYNQTGISSKYSFIETLGRANKNGSAYFESTVTFNNAEFNQSVQDTRAMFKTSAIIADNVSLPASCTAVPGIILNNCEINGYSDSARLHDMETLNALITYNNCQLKGDISYIGTDATDTGLGKVIIGDGTIFTAADTSFVKTYDATAIATYDGSTSGVYLADGMTLTDVGGGAYNVEAAVAA